MAHQTLLVETSGRVATVAVSRPEKLNALNAAAKAELGELFAALAADDAVDVVILTGAGEKAFVAGTDIAELAGLDRASGERFAAEGQRVFDRIERLGKPVIAAVNGYALGGGCELALACHLRVAAQGARFGLPEVGLGLIPGYGGTQRLARLIGRGRALEMILSGQPVPADEALRIGLVNRVVPLPELMPAARAIAEAIAAKGQLAVRRAMRAVLEGLDTSMPAGQAIEAALFGECCATGDAKEGIAAFLEKRKPAFGRS